MSRVMLRGDRGAKSYCNSYCASYQELNPCVQSNMSDSGVRSSDVEKGRYKELYSCVHCPMWVTQEWGADWCWEAIEAQYHIVTHIAPHTKSSIPVSSPIWVTQEWGAVMLRRDGGTKPSDRPIKQREAEMPLCSLLLRYIRLCQEFRRAKNNNNTLHLFCQTNSL